MSPNDAWNFTLKEYVSLISCDSDDSSAPDPSKMNKEYIRKLELRHEENRKKRQEKGLIPKPKEFVTNG